MSEENSNTTAKGTETPATATVDPKAAIQADIAKIETAISNLKEASEDLFVEEIANLNQKLDNAQKKLESLATDTKVGIQQAEEKAKTWSEKFREKHGVSVWVALIGGGYIVWQVVTAVARALGAM